MFSFLKNVFLYLDKKDKIFLILLQLVIILNSIFEAFSIFGVGFFFSSLMTNDFQLPVFAMNYIPMDKRLDDVYLTHILGVLTLIIFISTLIITLLNNLFLIYFSEHLSRKFKNDFFSYYLSQDILFHKKFTSNHLIKNLTNDLDRISNGIILPSLRIISKIIALILIIITLSVLRPFETISLSIFLFLIYFLVIFSLRKFLNYFGRLVSIINEDRIGLIQESISGIKDVILTKSKNFFLKPYKRLNSEFLKINVFYTASTFFPRTVIDIILFSTIILTILKINVDQSKDLNELIITLIILGFGAYRILPIVQDIYNSTIVIKGSKYVIELFYNDFNKIKKLSKSKPNFQNTKVDNQIFFENIKFSYNNKDEFNLKLKNVKIKIGKKTAIIGKSGSGKSTFIEILLGLIIKRSNKIYYDDVLLSQNYFNKNKFNISYVSQNPYVINDTIYANIFMPDSKKFDHKSVKKDKFIKEIMYNLDLNLFENKKKNELSLRKLGESGNKLSGGQRQRIAIARALYQKKEILVIDEGTSALDRITEQKILNYIDGLNFIKTIIFITHKINNIKDFDQIIFMDKGRVIDCGNFDYLFNKYEKFRKLSK